MLLIRITFLLVVFCLGKASLGNPIPIESQISTLNKDWHFFPHQLIDPKSQETSSEIESIASKFINLKSMGNKPDGAASFRKVIRLEKNIKSVVFKFPYCVQSCEFFINGKSIYKIGSPNLNGTSQRGRAGSSYVEYLIDNPTSNIHKFILN